ncbi:MAG: PDZ domain-containing protein [Planctomycetes bacterium]|nr:PDZ domain-containing protein [Planctomycetota bacterium]
MRLHRRIRSSSPSPSPSLSRSLSWASRLSVPAVLLAALSFGGPALAAPEEPGLDKLVKELQRYLERSEKDLQRLQKEVDALKEAAKAKEAEIAALRREIEALKKVAPEAPAPPAPPKEAPPKEAPKEVPKEAPEEAPRPPARLGLRVVESPDGVHVAAVEPGETGDVAGLASGDRIVDINGKAVSGTDDVRAALKGVRVGDKLAITYERAGRTATAVVLAGSRPGEAKRLQGEETPAAGPAYLGIQIQESAGGLAVVGVDRGGPAEKAGILPGDGIVALDGKKITTYPEILAFIRGHRAGDRVSIRVRRDGEEKEIPDLVLGAREGAAPAPAPVPEKKEAPAPETPAPRPRGSLGIEVEGVDGALRVALVLAGGASEGKLEVGDVVLAVQGKAVRTFEELRSILEPLRAEDEVRIKVRRGQEEKELEIRLGAWKE